jgi:hypothetical protein
MTICLPDLSDYPDSESRRRAENLSHELDLILTEMSGTETSIEKLRELNKHANRIWWEMNANIGKLLSESRIERQQDTRSKLNLTLSIVAILISIGSLTLSFANL